MRQPNNSGAADWSKLLELKRERTATADQNVSFIPGLFHSQTESRTFKLSEVSYSKLRRSELHKLVNAQNSSIQNEIALSFIQQLSIVPTLCVGTHSRRSASRVHGTQSVPEGIPTQSAGTIETSEV